MTTTKPRLEEFDILKGIGILSIIVGHIWREPFLYMYHVPLFFLVSGFFFKETSFRTALIGGFKKLFLYYWIAGFATFVLYCFFNHGQSLYYLRNLVFDYWKDKISVGPIWFLVSLFWCRLLYNFLYKNLSQLVITIGLIILATFQFINPLEVDFTIIPFGIITIIPALLFYHIGHLCHLLHHQENYPPKRLRIVIAVLAVTILTYFQNGRILGLIFGKVPFFPFSILNACLITYLLYELSSEIAKHNNIIKHFLSFCGENTLMILVFHNIEDRIIIPHSNELLVQFQYPFRYVFLCIMIIVNIFMAIGFAWIVLRIKTHHIKTTNLSLW